MKIATQEGLLPGSTFAEKVKMAEKLGFEGIELGGRGLPDRVSEIKAVLADSPIKISSICSGYRGVMLDADPAQRDLALGDIREILKAAGELGAIGLIFVPIFGGPRIPDLRPLADTISLEKDLLVAIMKQLAPVAEDAGTCLLLEPLNRYETHLIKRLSDATEITARVDSPAAKIMADFFHMGIEECDIPASIRKAGSAIQHVHLADNTRIQPGTGSTDFKAGFAALKEIGFTNYMALECGVAGEREAALADCVAYLKQCIA